MPRKKEQPPPAKVLPFRRKNRGEYTLTITPPSEWADCELEALTMSDDSMSGERIYEGDILILVVGLIRSEGVHVAETSAGKAYACLVSYKDGLIYLEPSNDEYKTEAYRPHQVKILGCVVRVYPNGDLSKAVDFDSPYLDIRSLGLVG